jgi:hypothetical protein
MMVTVACRQASRQAGRRKAGSTWSGLQALYIDRGSNRPMVCHITCWDAVHDCLCKQCKYMHMCRPCSVITLTCSEHLLVHNATDTNLIELELA